MIISLVFRKLVCLYFCNTVCSVHVLLACCRLYITYYVNYTVGTKSPSKVHVSKNVFLWKLKLENVEFWEQGNTLEGQVLYFFRTDIILFALRNIFSNFLNRFRNQIVSKIQYIKICQYVINKKDLLNMNPWGT